jgi:UPF0271 protein
MTKYIDINSDLGEAYGVYQFGNDEGLLNLVSSANVACGVHAGDPTVIRQTVERALACGVSVGAHPSYPDRQGFGRRVMELSAKALYDHVVYQLGALSVFVDVAGGRLRHVKPHGALYNVAAKDRSVADAIVAATWDVSPQLAMYAPYGSELAIAAADKGLAVVHEVFADRRYEADGALTPRTHADAVIHDVQAAIAQVVQMVQTGTVIARTGETVNIVADTVCLHGDNPDAPAFAAALISTLTEAGIQVQAPNQK